MSYNIIDQNLQSWDGSPITLQQGQGVQMKQTPVGDLVVAALNMAAQNDEGQLAVTSGGGPPEIIPVEPLMNAPIIWITNYEGNDFNITNISITNVPIWVAAWGPGFGNCGTLPDDGIFFSLRPYQCREAQTNPSLMQLAMRALGQYTVFVNFIGSKPSTYCVNAPETRGVPVEDYTEVTKNNALSISGNWLGKTLWVVNLSALTNQQGEVALTNL